MFRFYITDLLDGNVRGTNDEQLAQDLSQSEDHFIIDSQTGEWLNTGGRELISEYST